MKIKLCPQPIGRRKADVIVYSGRQGSEYTVSHVFKVGKFPQLIFGWAHSGIFIPEAWTCPLRDKGPLLCTCREEGRASLFYALLVLSIVFAKRVLEESGTWVSELGCFEICICFRVPLSLSVHIHLFHLSTQDCWHFHALPRTTLVSGNEVFAYPRTWATWNFHW